MGIAQPYTLDTNIPSGANIKTTFSVDFHEEEPSTEMMAAVDGSFLQAGGKVMTSLDTREGRAHGRGDDGGVGGGGGNSELI